MSIRVNPGRDKDVERALYAALRRHDGAAIARRMGIAYSTLQGWGEGQNPPPAWIAAAFYDATGDVAAAAEIAGFTEAGLVVSAAPKAKPSIGDVKLAVIEVGAEVGSVERDFVSAARDGRITHAERERIMRDLNHVKRAVAELESRLEADAA